MNALEEFDKLRHLPWDDRVAIIAAGLKALEKVVPPPPAPVEHRFEKGLYIRTMTIPAGSIFIGRKHLRGHEVHLIRGSAIYITAKGKFKVEAPYSIFSSPGFYMVAYIITDVEVETWHRDDEGTQDQDALEARDFEDPQILLSRGQTLLTHQEVA